ncbi:MAG: methyltransferase domain-containing protein [Cyanothece sp. SIO2G6]|nr:methyltransferase domain-containing protein [Cyanothece sp. SIO2G6]
MSNTAVNPLRQRIQTFYDTSSGLWERVWGEHMHHGYYGADGTARKDPYQAQIDLIEELLAFAGVTQAGAILDVGCGIGGSSLYLAEKFGAMAQGITLSPVQAQRAGERAIATNLNAQFQVADALQMPFADNCFDMVWTLESGEHMPDKEQFLRECYRVLKPGGHLMMATWCHRSTDPPAIAQSQPLTPDEQALLQSIYQIYHLPYIISLPEYEAIAQSLGFQQIQTADWSAAVAPFWDDVIRSAFSITAILGLLKAGPQIIQGAWAMRLMKRGYQRGLIRFGVLVARKADPLSSPSSP